MERPDTGTESSAYDSIDSNHEQGDDSSRRLELTHDLEVFVAQSGTPAIGADHSKSEPYVREHIERIHALHVISMALHQPMSSTMVKKQKGWFGTPLPPL